MAVDIPAALILPGNPRRNIYATGALNPWRDDISMFLGGMSLRYPDFLAAIRAIAGFLDTHGSAIDYRAPPVEVQRCGVDAPALVRQPRSGRHQRRTLTRGSSSSRQIGENNPPTRGWETQRPPRVAPFPHRQSPLRTYTTGVGHIGEPRCRDLSFADVAFLVNGTSTGATLRQRRGNDRSVRTARDKTLTQASPVPQVSGPWADNPIKIRQGAVRGRAGGDPGGPAVVPNKE